MDEKEFFDLISNDTRREILRSIAHEPKYLFQLAQELGKSQQSIQRHLQCLLEKGWIVQDQLVEGSKGLARKLYRIEKNLTVRITLSQHSFNFDVFEISIGEPRSARSPLDHVESLSRDLSINVLEALERGDIDFEQKISRLNAVLEQLGSIETFLISRKLTITGELNETISMKLEGDAHRKDRELAYTIFSSSAPITIDLIQKEIETERPELLASLRRLHEKHLLPKKGIRLMNKLESTLSVKPE